MPLARTFCVGSHPCQSYRRTSCNGWDWMLLSTSSLKFRQWEIDGANGEVSLVITSPIALITGLIFLFKDYSISTLFSNPDSLPWYIKSSLGLGIMVTMMSAIHYLGNWLERKRNPKTYPLDQDYKPSEAQNIGAMWGTALSGKRYGVSSSIHSRGEIIVSNQDEPS